MRSRTANFVAVIALLGLIGSGAEASKLQPLGTALDLQLAKLSVTQSERRLAGLSSQGVQWFSSPVHEEATHRAFGCNAPFESRSCAQASSAPAAVLDGVRWNDNPPFQLAPGFTLPNGDVIAARCVGETIKLPRRSDCWLTVFRASDEYSKRRYFNYRTGVMLNRSHFGDLQFFHSMASRVGDTAATTKASIMVWAEFTYNVALGEIAGDIQMKNVPLPALAALFPTSSATVENLFLLGDSTYRGTGLRLFAFGSLLHMVQDSFSASHVVRDLQTQGRMCTGMPGTPAPAKVIRFSVYGAQDPKLHGDHDAANRLEAHLRESQPSVVDIGRTLKQFLNARKPWVEVAKYMDCVYELADEQADADAGVAPLQ